MTHVDILNSNVVGPDKSRQILNISSRWKVEDNPREQYMPSWLYPIGNTASQDRQIIKKFPTSIDRCIMKGFRRKTLLSLLKYHSLADNVIILINEYILFPSKSIRELTTEVLENKPQLMADTNAFDPSLYDYDNFAYDSESFELL